MRKQTIKRVGATTILIGFLAGSLVPIVDWENSDKIADDSNSITYEVLTLEEHQQATTENKFYFYVQSSGDDLSLKNALIQDIQTLKPLINSETQPNLEQETLEEQEGNTLENQITDEEWDLLYRIARCEAGGWCQTFTECGECKDIDGIKNDCLDAKLGQKNVVYVVLNRMTVKDCSIKEVILAENQFDTVTADYFYTIHITDVVKENVREAVRDYKPGVSAQGAIAFKSGDIPLYWYPSDYHIWKWVFTDEVGHGFYIQEK